MQHMFPQSVVVYLLAVECGVVVVAFAAVVVVAFAAAAVVVVLAALVFVVVPSVPVAHLQSCLPRCLPTLHCLAVVWNWLRQMLQVAAEPRIAVVDATAAFVGFDQTAAAVVDAVAAAHCLVNPNHPNYLTSQRCCCYYGCYY